jgi:hypothetical protein
MYKNNYEYAFRSYCNDGISVSDGLIEFCSKYLETKKIKPKFLNNFIINKERKISQCYNILGYYNNFLISKISFWMRPDVQDFLKEFDNTGYQYTRRWNDLISQAVTIQIFMEPTKVYHFTDWCYEHCTFKGVYDDKAEIEWGGLYPEIKNNKIVETEYTKNWKKKYSFYHINTFDTYNVKEILNVSNTDLLYCRLPHNNSFRPLKNDDVYYLGKYSNIEDVYCAINDHWVNCETSCVKRCLQFTYKPPIAFTWFNSNDHSPIHVNGLYAINNEKIINTHKTTSTLSFRVVKDIYIDNYNEPKESGITKKKMIISMNHTMDPAGFFVYLEFVINGILYCRANPEFTDIPEVIFDEHEYCRKRTNGGTQEPFLSLITNPYFDSNYGKNMWDYFFYIKKTSNEKCELYNPFYLKGKLCSTFKCKSGCCGREFWSTIHNGNPDVPNIKCYPRGSEYNLCELYGSSYNQEIKDWYYKNRVLANQIINEYIGIQDFVTQTVNEQWASFFEETDYVLGIHIRGTDKVWGGKKVVPEDYFPYIDKIKLNNLNFKIFLATDDPDYIEPIILRYPGIVKYTNAQRNKQNVFLCTDGSTYHKGLDVLTDSLLLSKCNFLIKSNSAVSEFAIYFNLDLHENSLNLQYNCSSFLEN